MRKPGVATGALVGAFLTASLIAGFYLGWKLAGLPFVPFQVFDWTARVLPGGVITFGIDSMVKVIRLLKIADTSSAAKAAEQSMAIALFLVAGALLGAVLFAILRALRVRRPVLPGIGLGLAAGVGAVLVARSLGQVSNVSPAIREDWTLAAFAVWGAALGWANRRLTRERIELRGEIDRSAWDDTVERLDRRSFLVRLGGATATITVAGAVIGSLAGGRRRHEVVTGKRWSADHPLPNAGADVTPAAGTRPEYTALEDHYRIDITTTPPVIDGATWRLKVGGLVERPLELTMEQIRGYEPLHQFVTLACISNPVAGSLIGTTRWTGVSLQRLLPDLRLAPTATHLKLSSADRFYEIVALDTLRSDARVMLAYDWDGVPLTTKHGFPLRIYIPDLYGMKQPKWLLSVEAMDHWEPGYWVKRGWDRTARMKATSVIDTVSVDMMLTQADSNTRIPVGGIAHAGARGISKVEVRVDDGPWQEARLRTPLSDTTWVVWRYDWPFQPGNHTFTVRCFDGGGVAQIVDTKPPHPSGASGLHSKSMML
ncbi:MAG TPA: molybdopterin-dependent oxidoreductase [Thermoanaerobaculia bacterium]|jgi:DMSO/TMAO reductase YedYZ molybdopterin-dependent catalytic subunit|nr:molybdopterin-dependent oxidoreductase [Thermoanaerobaculia bacterium]